MKGGVQMSAVAMVAYQVQDEIKIKKEIVNNMVKMGQQVPLRELMSPSDIFDMTITSHVVQRFQKRYKKMMSIEVENHIKSALNSNAVIVDLGHSDRWMVYAKGSIFIIDENCVYTVYDANGNDRNNITNPTKSKLAYINKKTKRLDKMKNLFEMIK